MRTLKTFVERGPFMHEVAPRMDAVVSNWLRENASAVHTMQATVIESGSMFIYTVTVLVSLIRFISSEKSFDSNSKV